MNTTDMLNPLDPMAYLAPAVATDSEVSTYLYAATLGVSVNFGEEYTSNAD